MLRVQKKDVFRWALRDYIILLCFCAQNETKKNCYFFGGLLRYSIFIFSIPIFFLVAVQRTLYSTFRYGFGAWKEAFFNRHTHFFILLSFFSLCVSAIFPEHSKKHNKYKIGEQYQNNSQLSCCEKWLKIFWLSIYNWSASYLFVFCKFFFFAANFGVFRNSVVLQIKISVAHVPFFLVSFRFEIFRQGILLYELNGI